jgi:hypothetical protein
MDSKADGVTITLTLDYTTPVRGRGSEKVLGEMFELVSIYDE